jgi:hypothetical protein
MNKQDELIQALAEKYPVKHKPTCYLNQNWDEAIQALMDTPEAYRGEDWYIAVSEITDKRSNCSCGAKDEFISDLRTLLSQLVPGEGWISVKDKLPLVNDEVLTITSDGWQRIITYGSTMRGFPDLVTHWMPLPKSPSTD